MDYTFEYDYSEPKVWAKKVKDNLDIHADDAYKKDGPFYCTDTFEELIVRRCNKKINHFAYKARQSPILSKEETELHKTCKQEIRDALAEVFPEGKWEIERQGFVENKVKGLSRVIPDVSGRIPDTSGESKNGHPVIIEIQASYLTLDQIRARTIEYTKRNAYILWIIPLKEQLGEDNFRPRLFERFLHQMYYGRTYYWTKGNGRFLLPVHYETAYRYIQESHWFEADGTERYEGGYEKPYKNLKKPLFGDLIDIASDFHTENKPPFTPTNNDLMYVPACKIYKDNLQHWWK